MSEKNNLPQAIRGPMQELGQLLPVVERVHGEAHPELIDVGRLFVALREGLEAGATAGESRLLMDKLRGLTKNYTAPEDACQAFRRTYAALAKVDGSLRD